MLGGAGESGIYEALTQNGNSSYTWPTQITSSWPTNDAMRKTQDITGVSPYVLFENILYTLRLKSIDK